MRSNHKFTSFYFQPSALAGAMTCGNQVIDTDLTTEATDQA
jgi:hypothetical protein